MKIKELVPKLFSQEAVIADKIASIAIPSTGQSVWDQYIEKKQALGQNIGVPFNASGGLGARIRTPQSTLKLQELSSKFNYETRAEQARRTGLKLPNLNYIPQTGIGSSIGQKSRPGGVEQQVEGGIGAAAAAGDTQFVDDKGWPVTLKQLLGSRLLSTELLQKASIQNVRKYISATGGTADQRAEVEFMMQRAMLEGFIRGVDITKDLKPGGIQMQFVGIPGKVIGSRSNGTVNGKAADIVKFDTSFWDGRSEDAQYTLFLHEVVGHAMLNVDANHNNGTSAKFQQSERIMTPVYKDSILENYDKMMDGLFNESSVPTKSKFKVQDMGAASYYDKSWFPAITGVQEQAAPEGTPAAAVNKGDQQVSSGPPRLSAIGRGSDTQASITGAGSVSSGDAISGQPNVGATLSGDIQTATKTFAAGMADLSKPSADMSQAGMLLKSG